MKFRRVKDSNRHKQWTTRPMNKPVNNCIRSIAAFLLMSSKKRSSFSSALTFFLIIISHKPRSENFQPPTCLHSSCPYLTPVTSRCHLHVTNVRTTHGRYFMERHFIPLSSSSLKVRSDQPTGLIIKTFNAVTCQPSGPFTLAEKLQTATRPSQIGQQESYSMPSRRKEKDNKTSSSGQCIEEHITTPPTKLEAMKWLRSLWLTKGSSPRPRSTRLPTAAVWD